MSVMSLENQYSNLEKKSETFFIPYYPILRGVSVISERCDRVEYVTASCSPSVAASELVSTSEQQPLTLLQVLKRTLTL